MHSLRGKLAKLRKCKSSIIIHCIIIKISENVAILRILLIIWSPSLEQNENKVLLIILDGWGHREETEYNAISSANTPNWDLFLTKYPNSFLKCSGTDVGLPSAQMGNSEVGHMHIGAGRLIQQDLTRINQVISDNKLSSVDVLTDCFNRLKKTEATLHLVGLCSNGGVHSHINHLEALIDSALAKGVKNIRIHAILDGRDTDQKSAEQELPKLENFLKTRPAAKIATIQGRYYAMDRNEKWDRTELAYNLISSKKTELWYQDAMSALAGAYGRKETDEFISPSAIIDKNNSDYTIKENDIGLFFNFRADRARQLTASLSVEKFSGFSRKQSPFFKNFVTMTSYADYFENPVIFPNSEIKNTLGEVISNHQKKQVRISETEKYAHVTFFLNGGRESPFTGEERILVPSPDVPTYDLAPEMSAEIIATKICKLLTDQKYDAIISNFANADMVGHTGDFKAAIKAIEILDKCLGKIYKAAKANNYDILMTADHGNAELMCTSNNSYAPGLKPHTAHTNNLVPVVYIGSKNIELKTGDLKDIAPTMLSLLGLAVPEEMTGKNLSKC